MDSAGGPQSGLAHYSSGESPSSSGLPVRDNTLEGGHAPLPGDDSLSCHVDDLGDTQPAFLDMLHNSDPALHLPIPPESLPGSLNDLDFLQDPIPLSDLRTSMDFIKALQDTALSDPSLGMSPEAVGCLCNPLRDQPGDALDPDTRLAIDLYLGNSSEAAYETNRRAILRHFPDTQIPTYYKIKWFVTDLTGVESVVHHMCTQSCIAYTGPFLDLEACPVCSEPCYDQFQLQASGRKERVPCQEYHTIPIGPQIQVLYRDRESSTHGQYLCRERERVLSEIKEHGVLGEYSDVLHGLDMIKAFQDELITGDDIVLLFSINGAQLYAQKSLACWIYIWVLLNLEPSRCYKK